MMTKTPVEIEIELKDVEAIEKALSELEKTRDSHPDITLDAKIRVCPKD